VDAGHLIAAAARPGAAWKEIGIWFGAPLMVAHGLVTFALQYKTIGRALAGFGRGRGAEGDDIADAIETPIAWFAMGTAIAGTAVVVLAWLAFDIPVHYGALAVFMTFFLAQSYSANLMTASITSSASAEAADLLTDLKAGYLLGAHPRRQFVAQFAGILSGTIASVLCYFVLVPDATALTGSPGRPPQFAAPAAQQWKAVAEIFRLGIGNLHPMAREGIAIGLLAGSVLAVTERAFPREKRWMPSATGIGLGLILPFATSLSFVLGAAGAWLYARIDSRQAERFVVPIASGVIAGESIVGVVVATLNNFVLM